MIRNVITKLRHSEVTNIEVLLKLDIYYYYIYIIIIRPQLLNLILVSPNNMILRIVNTSTFDISIEKLIRYNIALFNDNI